jgi:hypothetical protein
MKTGGIGFWEFVSLEAGNVNVVFVAMTSPHDLDL